jgi:hypothetical protein
MHSAFEYAEYVRHSQRFVPTHDHLHRADACVALRERLARKHFFRMYRLRNLLFRLNHRLAHRLAL